MVGAGPAGIAASIYLKRAGIDVTLFEKREVGGLLLNAHLVENYPGFPMGIKGANLCNLMKDQLNRWNIKPIMEEVKQISIENDNFILNTSDGKSKSKFVILATGTKPRELGILGERELVGKLVFYEIKDLLPQLKPRNICIVIGGGDAAFDYSLNLADNGATVELYFRSKRPRCLPLLEKRVKSCATIHIHPSFTPIDIKEKKGKPEIRFRSAEKNANSISDDTATCTSRADYILIACGREPSKELLSGGLEESNIRGLFLAGDVGIANFRQVGIAVGEGIKAAMNAETYLRS